MDRYDADDLRRYRERKRRQKEYQADYRRRLKKERIPDREEIAAAMLAMNLKAMARSTPEVRDTSIAKLARYLEEVGVGTRRFDYENTVAAVRGMIAREIKRLRRRERGE